MYDRPPAEDDAPADLELLVSAVRSFVEDLRTTERIDPRDVEELENLIAALRARVDGLDA